MDEVEIDRRSRNLKHDFGVLKSIMSKEDFREFVQDLLQTGGHYIESI